MNSHELFRKILLWTFVKTNNFFQQDKRQSILSPASGIFLLVIHFMSRQLPFRYQYGTRRRHVKIVFIPENSTFVRNLAERHSYIQTCMMSNLTEQAFYVGICFRTLFFWNDETQRCRRWRANTLQYHGRFVNRPTT